MVTGSLREAVWTSHQMGNSPHIALEMMGRRTGTTGRASRGMFAKGGRSCGWYLYTAWCLGAGGSLGAILHGSFGLHCYLSHFSGPVSSGAF
jgi:hypothetical protein